MGYSPVRRKHTNIMKFILEHFYMHKCQHRRKRKRSSKGRGWHISIEKHETKQSAMAERLDHKQTCDKNIRVWKSILRCVDTLDMASGIMGVSWLLMDGLWGVPGELCWLLSRAYCGVNGALEGQWALVISQMGDYGSEAEALGHCCSKCCGVVEWRWNFHGTIMGLSGRFLDFWAVIIELLLRSYFASNELWFRDHGFVFLVFSSIT